MTPLRDLTAPERDALQKLRSEAASPVLLDQLLRELLVSRAVIRIVRSQMRCLPGHVCKVLNELPHRHATSVEYSQD